MGVQGGGVHVSSYTQLSSSVVRNANLYTDIAIGARVPVLFSSFDTVDQGTWAAVVSGTNLYQCLAANSTTAQNDAFTKKIYLSAGTWTFRLLHRTNSAMGILTLNIDGTSAGTIDCYSAGATDNVTSNITGISVTTNGIKDVQFIVATKNGASSDYELNLVMGEFIKTA